MKILLFITIMSFTLNGSGQDSSSRAIEGQPREIVDVDGVVIPVYDFEGFKPMLASHDDVTFVINFWATWCKPCVEEMPHFVQLAKEMDNEDVRFLFVSLDFRKNLEKGVVPFIRTRGIEDQVVMLNDPDANSWIGQVNAEWSGAIPATLIYRGNKREFHEKMLTYDELKSIVQSFLKL
jgi:thiol-disulfide isomerase/thioredoxin